MSGQRRRRAGSPVILVALLLVAAGFLLALLAAHVDPPRYAARPAPSATLELPIVNGTQVPPDGADASDRTSSRPLREIGSLVLGLYLLIVVGALLALAALLVHALSGRAAARRRAAQDEPTERGHDLEPSLVAQRMADAAAAGLDDLADEAQASDAIIACWQRLRAAAAEAGVRPVPSDTPEEAIARVLHAGAASGAAAGPLSTLAALYREARFSDHAMSRGDVWVARRSLQAIQAELRPEASDAH